MVATDEENVGGVEDLVEKEDEVGGGRVSAAIDVVTEEDVFLCGGGVEEGEEIEEVEELAVDVTDDGDGGGEEGDVWFDE